MIAKNRKKKEKNSVAENKHAQKDRKGMKNNNDEDDNDEENSLDDELSKGNGKKKQAT